MKLSDQDKIGMTAAEIASLEASDADELLNQGPGEDSTTSKQGTDETDETDETASAASADETDETSAPAPVDEAAAQKYVVEATDFAAKRTELKVARRDIEAKWSAGDLSDEEREAQLDALDEQRDALLIAQTRAATLKEANDQAERARVEATIKAENAAMKALADAEAARKGIDYKTDAKAQAEFDMMFGAVKANPDNAGLTAAQLVAEAHKAVCALRGIATAPAAKTPKPAAAARDVPVTLAGLPAAASNVVQDDLIAQFSQLSGDAAERFMASLPANQVDKLMRWADSQVGA
jgi:hypothetical protein